MGRSGTIFLISRITDDGKHQHWKAPNTWTTDLKQATTFYVFCNAAHVQEQVGGEFVTEMFQSEYDKVKHAVSQD